MRQTRQRPGCPLSEIPVVHWIFAVLTARSEATIAKPVACWTRQPSTTPKSQLKISTTRTNKPCLPSHFKPGGLWQEFLIVEPSRRGNAAGTAFHAPTEHLSDDLFHRAAYLTGPVCCHKSFVFIRLQTGKLKSKGGKQKERTLYSQATFGAFMCRSKIIAKGYLYMRTSFTCPSEPQKLEKLHTKHSSSRFISAPSPCTHNGITVDMSSWWSSKIGCKRHASTPFTCSQNFLRDTAFK